MQEERVTIEHAEQTKQRAGGKLAQAIQDLDFCRRKAKRLAWRRRALNLQAQERRSAAERRKLRGQEVALQEEEDSLRRSIATLMQRVTELRAGDGD